MILNIGTENPIREKNISSALEYIFNEGAVSRAQIASVLHINKPSVSEIVKYLINENILEEIGMGNSSHLGGRKPILVRIKKDWALFLSIDIGYNYLTYYLTYANGSTILYEVQKNRFIDRNNIVQELISYIHHIIEQSPSSDTGIANITVSVHGSVSEDTILFTPYYDLVSLPIKEMLEKEFSIPVVYCNEANLSSIANQALHKEKLNLVSISIHSGVGSGIIMSGQPYQGSKNFSGEIGHMILRPDGRECPCGNQGCLETYCSEKAILDDFYNEFHKHMSLLEIRKLYDKNDVFTVCKFNQVAHYFAIGVNNLLVFFDPQIIYFNCALFQIFPELILKIQGYLRCFMTKKAVLKISPIADRSIIIGGILLGMKKVFQIQNIQLGKLEFK